MWQQLLAVLGDAGREFESLWKSDARRVTKRPDSWRFHALAESAEQFEVRTLLAGFGNQILHDGEAGSAPLLEANCFEYMSEAAGEGIAGSNSLKTEHTGFHAPVLFLYCGGRDRVDFTPFDAIEFYFRSPSATPGNPLFKVNNYQFASHEVSILDYIDGGVIDNTFRRVRIPIADLQTESWDLGNVETLRWNEQPIGREYFIDNVRLLDLTAPVADDVAVYSNDVLKVGFDSRYNPNTIRDLSHYSIVSATDPNFASPINPTDTGRHQKFDHFSESSSAPIVNFDVFLQFDSPLANGHTYSLSVQDIADHAGNFIDPAAFEFTFDDGSLHNPQALHVNQVGYLTDGPKLGYFGAYVGDLGGTIIAVGEDAAGDGVALQYDDQAGGSPDVGGWSAEALPVTETLRDVAAVREDLAWGVGDNGTIVRWDGDVWQTVTSPVSDNLTAIAFGPTGLGWIVGENGVALQWDGSNWQQVATGVTSTLNDVWVAKRLDIENIGIGGLAHAWAVGAGGVILR